MKSQFKLQDLYIKIDGALSWSKNIELRANLFKLLQKLHRRGFYQRLHLFTPNLYPAMTSLPSLETLYFQDVLDSMLTRYEIVLTPFSGLKELKLNFSNVIWDMNTLIGLKKLEQIHFYNTDLKELSPFIKQLPNLKLVKIDHFSIVGFDNVFFVSTWNKEREKLEKAKKVTIYFEEKFFMTLKTVVGLTKLNLVECKSAESREWTCPFLMMNIF